MKKILLVFLMTALMMGAAPAPTAEADPEAIPIPEATANPTEEAPLEPVAEFAPETPPEPAEEPEPEISPEPMAEITPEPTEVPTTPVPYETVSFSPVTGYDLSVVRSRSYPGDTIPLYEAAARLNRELADAMEQICQFAQADEVLVSYRGTFSPQSCRSILAKITAVFFARAEIDPSDAAGPVSVSGEEFHLFRQVFWDMLLLEPVVRQTDTFRGEFDENGQPMVHTQRVLQINVDTVDFENLYPMLTDSQQLLLKLYCSNNYLQLLENACSTTLCISSGETFSDLGILIPENLDPTRLQVIRSAVSLVGRVPYFWGGKSEVIGWDTRWGAPAVITSNGNWQEETVRPFGLDCSGFIAWSLINGANDTAALSIIGHGTDLQFSRCAVIAAEAAQPGDLAFTLENDGVVSHGGIIVGRNSTGELMICHCSGREENIVIEPISVAGCNVVCTPKDFYSLTESK